MKRNIFIKSIALVAVMAAFAACSTDDELTATVPGTGIDIPDGYYFIINNGGWNYGVETRVGYDGEACAFEEDDRVGIYAMDADGVVKDYNAQYKVVNVTDINYGTTRQVLEPVGERVERQDGYRYVVYYPYDPNMTIERLQSYRFSVRTNQSAGNVAGTGNTEITSYEASDLLWDVAEDQTTDDGTTHYALITMDHAMADITLVVTGDNEAEAYVVNTPTSASGINLTTKGGKLTYNTNRDIPTLENNEIRMADFDRNENGLSVFRAIIPACQTIPAGKPLLKITIDGVTHKYVLKENLELKPGMSYEFIYPSK